MSTTRTTESPGSPVPGAIPEPVRVQHDDAPVATAGIVGIAIVIAAIISSRGSQGWQIGLVVSLASLSLAAVLWSSRRL